VLFGTVYLSELIDRYDGRVEPALAAYNAGASRADRWWPASGRDPERFVEDIPFIETRLYVKRILSQWWMYRVLYEKG
jgi:soluble lytic murein transglycosylase